MNGRVITFRRILLTASIALFVPLSGQAQPIPDDLDGPYWSQLLAWHCEFGCGVPLNGSVGMRGLAQVSLIPKMPCRRYPCSRS